MAGALILAVATLAGCVPYPDQQTSQLSGKVVDAVTQEPIAGAMLTYQEFPECVAKTLPDGSFELPAVKKWRLRAPFFDHINEATLVVTAPNYSSYTENVEAWNGRRETRIIGLKAAQQGVPADGTRPAGEPRH